MAKTYFKGLLLATFLCAVSVTMNGQNLQEVVYLKNGGVIRGLIIEQKPNESLKIQTVDGNVFVYKMDEVDKVTLVCAPCMKTPSCDFPTRRVALIAADETHHICPTTNQ